MQNVFGVHVHPALKKTQKEDLNFFDTHIFSMQIFFGGVYKGLGPPQPPWRPNNNTIGGGQGFLGPPGRCCRDVRVARMRLVPLPLLHTSVDG